MATLGQLLKNRTVSLSIRQNAFGNQKQIRGGVKVEAVQADGVTPDPSMVKAMKSLLDSPELEAITQFDGETTALLRMYGHSSRNIRPGVYTISRSLILRVQQMMLDRMRQRAELVSRAVEAYPMRCLEAAQDLGVAYNPDDYPSQEDFADSFRILWQWKVEEVPAALRELSPQLADEEESKEAALRERLAEEIRESAREVMAGMIAHFRKVLEPGADGKRKRFYDTTITNIQEFCDLFQFKDVTSDDDLGKIVAEARQLVSGMDPEEFRRKGAGADAYRRDIQSEMAKLEQAIEPLVTSSRTRRIRIDRDDETAVA